MTSLRVTVRDVHCHAHLEFIFSMLDHIQSKTAGKGMGSRWDAGGREGAIKERVGSTCATDCCTPTVKCVTHVTIKRDFALQIQ